MLTCPPEKPTAITPSSLLAERNFGGIVEGEVMFRAHSNVSRRMGAASSRRSSDVRSRSIQQYQSEQLACQARNQRVSRGLQEYATFQQRVIKGVGRKK